MQAQQTIADAGCLGRSSGCSSYPIEVEGSRISQPQHHQPLGAGALQQVDHQLLPGLAAELFTVQRVAQAWPAAFQFRCGLIFKQPHRQYLTTPGR